MSALRIGLLNKKRGNFRIQEKFAGSAAVVDETSAEIAHHEAALRDAGHEVRVIDWGPDILRHLPEANIDLAFNVSSLVEAAVLEELEIPFVGSDSFTIALATEKSLAKKIWRKAALPTSPFHVARTEQDCEVFRSDPPFAYPLFIKPVAGRGSAGITEDSVVENYDQLVEGVRERYRTIGQPVLIERFLRGREITQCVLGNDGDVRVLPPLEIAYAYQYFNFRRIGTARVFNDYTVKFLCSEPFFRRPHADGIAHSIGTRDLQTLYRYFQFLSSTAYKNSGTTRRNSRVLSRCQCANVWCKSGHNYAPLNMRARNMTPIASDANMAILTNPCEVSERVNSPTVSAA